MPQGFTGGRNVDTSKLKTLQLISSFPLYCKYRLSNIRLIGERPRQLTEAEFFPFIDRYGQNMHADWPEKVKSDNDLRNLQKDELATLKPRIAAWNRYGGWADGPRLKSTGFFRVEKYRGNGISSIRKDVFSFRGASMMWRRGDLSTSGAGRDVLKLPMNLEPTEAISIWKTSERNMRKSWIPGRISSIAGLIPGASTRWEIGAICVFTGMRGFPIR